MLIVLPAQGGQKHLKRTGGRHWEGSPPPCPPQTAPGLIRGRGRFLPLSRGPCTHVTIGSCTPPVTRFQGSFPALGHSLRCVPHRRLPPRVTCSNQPNGLLDLVPSACPRRRPSQPLRGEGARGRICQALRTFLSDLSGWREVPRSPLLNVEPAPRARSTRLPGARSVSRVEPPPDPRGALSNPTMRAGLASLGADSNGVPGACRG